MAKKVVPVAKDYVKYFIYRDSSDTTAVKNVIINGVKYSVPIGKEVMVPRVVRDELERSRVQDEKARELDRQLQSQDQVIEV